MTQTESAFERVRASFQRNARVLSRRPAVGRGTAVTTVSMLDGLACEIADGARRLACDMTEKHGGSGTGPDPGMLGRGALGACVAMGIVRHAALEAIELESLTVRVEADYDAGGEFATTDVRPGYTAMRVVVTATCSAGREKLQQICATALKHTSFLDLFENGTDVRVDVQDAHASALDAGPFVREEVTS